MNWHFREAAADHMFKARQSHLAVMITLGGEQTFAAHSADDWFARYAAVYGAAVGAIVSMEASRKITDTEDEILFGPISLASWWRRGPMVTMVDIRRMIWG